jgi:hypothetical protein
MHVQLERCTKARNVRKCLGLQYLIQITHGSSTYMWRWAQSRANPSPRLIPYNREINSDFSPLDLPRPRSIEDFSLGKRVPKGSNQDSGMKRNREINRAYQGNSRGITGNLPSQRRPCKSYCSVPVLCHSSGFFPRRKSTKGDVSERFRVVPRCFILTA